MLWAKFYFGIILPLVAGHQTNGTGCIYGAKPRIFLRMTLRSFFPCSQLENRLQTDCRHSECHHDSVSAFLTRNLDDVLLQCGARRLSSELLSDTKPASDQDLLILGPAASL